jgi:hypothetical protein
MTKSFPYLAMDAAGERTILCDYPVPMFDNAIKPRSTKMTNTMLSSDAAFRDRCERNAQQVRRKYGLATDTAAMDDETIEKLKGFLKNKLSAEDHETLCNMLDGDSEAPDDVEGKPAMDGLSARQRMEAADSTFAKRAKDQDDFFARFPDAARIRIDNSGIQPRVGNLISILKSKIIKRKSENQRKSNAWWITDRMRAA